MENGCEASSTANKRIIKISKKKVKKKNCISAENDKSYYV